MGIRDGQPITIRSDASKRELIIDLLPTMTDYK